MLLIWICNYMFIMFYEFLYISTILDIHLSHIVSDIFYLSDVYYVLWIFVHIYHSRYSSFTYCIWYILCIRYLLIVLPYRICFAFDTSIVSMHHKSIDNKLKSPLYSNLTTEMMTMVYNFYFVHRYLNVPYLIHF